MRVCCNDGNMYRNVAFYQFFVSVPRTLSEYCMLIGSKDKKLCTGIEYRLLDHFHSYSYTLNDNTSSIE